MNAPLPEMERLSVFIGRWLTEGETAAEAGTPAASIVASDIYQWAPGGRFVMHPAYGESDQSRSAVSRSLDTTRPPDSFRRIFLTAKGTRSARPCRITTASGRGKEAACAVEACSVTTVEH
jgi:hypothetical protein